MGDVVGMDGKRIDPLHESLKQAFFDFGQARATVSELAMPVPAWRSAARAVARDIGRSVQTMVAGGQVFAVLTDWPIDDREEAIQGKQLRAAVEAAADSWNH